MQDIRANSDAQKDKCASTVKQVMTGNAMSQRQYRPTPYMPTAWEVIGEKCRDLAFAPMVLEVMCGYQSAPDPMFEVFGGAVPFAAGDRIEVAGSATRLCEKETREEQPAVDPELLQKQLAKSFAEGRAEGYAAGAADAEAKNDARYEEITERLKVVTERVEQAYHERLAMVEQYALQLAVEISKKILGSAVELRPEYILEIIRSGLHNLGAAKPMKVRVSPQDYEFIEVVGLPADLTPQETGVQYVSDEAIKAGCVIETDFGEVNLELDQMWEQVKNSLYAVCK